MNRMMLGFLTMSLAVASAASHKVTLFQPSVINGTELKPGQYKVEVVNNKAVIRSGKQVVEAEVAVQTADSKFANTSVKYENANGQYKVQEIRLGGTNTKLTFNGMSGAAGSQ